MSYNCSRHHRVPIPNAGLSLTSAPLLPMCLKKKKGLCTIILFFLFISHSVSLSYHIIFPE
ncbi:hypothetical protein BACCOP_00305 [Phocaeicola coprocola DSM 17136]|uniref:Uncharacterized protein n=1 Tax=Phocaeicola coprocola DSM 17136 TaxID=470145 RepID=B3JEL2_9BACT|nr:hypothetical protein BACCOP_00305 [Phocaeicola coprocola DSM 17136]